MIMILWAKPEAIESTIFNHVLYKERITPCLVGKNHLFLPKHWMKLTHLCVQWQAVWLYLRGLGFHEKKMVDIKCWVPTLLQLSWGAEFWFSPSYKRLMDCLRYHHHHHHHLTRPFRSPLTLSSGFFVSFSLRNSSLGKELYGFSPAIKPQLLISLLFLALALATCINAVSMVCWVAVLTFARPTKKQALVMFFSCKF